MNKQNQHGFAAIESVLVLVIIAIVGFTGWFVWHAKNTSDKVLKPTNTSAQTVNGNGSTDNAANPSLKTYSNAYYGFSFRYPSNWTLATELKDIGRGEPEGNIVVTSPEKTVLTFNANLGGKGGDCGDDQSNDSETARTCITFDNLLLVPFASGLKGRTFYYYEAKLTPPTSVGGAPTYAVGVTDNNFPTPVLGSHLIDAPVDLISPIKGDLEISYTGKDDALNTSSAFFATNEIKEVSAVLKTLRLSNE